MASMEKELPTRRRDDLGDFHDLLPAACDDCGCTYFYAKDDREMIWEPEHSWNEECRDRDCHCHVAAVIGQHRS
jgi:hypothetical protein